MKRGYSAKHGCIIEADCLTYQDCRDDRVTCEICGERAFKVERRSNLGSVHYLSHHKRTNTSRDCEARIEARMKDEASIKRMTNANHSADRKQGLKDRVAALARVLSSQFPDVAKYAEQTSRRVERYTEKDKNSILFPQILVDYSSNATMFQFASRRDGIEVHDDDLMRQDYGGHWLHYVATIHTCGMDCLRRTRCEKGSRQEQWANDMTALICLAQSEEALMALVCHAWADLCINGVTGGNRHHNEAVRRMKVVSDTVIGKNLSNLLEENIIDPLTGEGESYYTLASAALVARMRDILREIDYSLPVPAARTIATPRQMPLRVHKKGHRHTKLVSGVGAGVMKMVARHVA